MRVAEKIEKKILQMIPGNTFKYQELGIEPEEYSAATKAIERLLWNPKIADKKGLLTKVSRQ